MYRDPMAQQMTALEAAALIEARNATRATYSTTGFPDPAGGDDAYFFPAATRSLRFGLRYGW